MSCRSDASLLLVALVMVTSFIGCASGEKAPAPTGPASPRESTPRESSPREQEKNDSQAEEENGEEAPTKGESPTGGLQEKVFLDLVKDAVRAELREGGLLIDLGSADMHKFTRGNWENGWNLRTGNGTAEITGKPAWLDLVVDAPVRELVLRASGKGKLQVRAGKAKQALRLSESLQEHRIPLRLGKGRHRLSFSGKGAELDWLWLSEKSGAKIHDLSFARTDGDQLLAPSEREFRFFFVVPEEAELHFDAIGDKGSRLIVSLQTDDEERMLLDWPTGKGPKKVSLHEFAGQPVALRMLSEGTGVRWLGPRIVVPPKQEFAPKRRPKNVILLLIDTQRADSFAPVGKSSALKTPGYDRLAGAGTTFTNAYNNENWTKPSVATTLSGLYPESHMARWRKDRCSRDLVFLSEHFQDEGFATAGLISNMSAGAKYGFDQGWDHFEKTDNAELTFRSALTWLTQQENNKRSSVKPFFLYIQTIDPHVPFDVPKGDAEKLYGGEYKGSLGPSFEQSEEDALNEGKLRLDDKDRRWLRALYDAEVLYHDKYLASFVDELEKRKLLDDTLFVVLNDHGEEFGEMGRYGHGWTMGETLFRSPLLMHSPGFLPAQEITEIVEHVDVAATILDAMGLAEKPMTQGRSFLWLLHGKSAPKDLAHRSTGTALLYGRPKIRAMRYGSYKLVVTASGKDKLFDLEDNPKEIDAKNLLHSHPLARRVGEVELGHALASPDKDARNQVYASELQIRPEVIEE